ncbi:MAG TPA: hypothetical protein VL523_17075, partial [Terriglobia bacterium]|nr:hypothetical protein [Terriglobia bacterium]
MFGKSKGDRWDDTIDYLNHYFPCHDLHEPLGDHIESIVPAGQTRNAISKELSLGSRPDGKDDPHYADNTDRRHAMRGLLLCQRVYYSKLWARKTWTLGEQPIPDEWCLGANWKVQSLNHWGHQNEAAIREAIAMFVPIPGATRDDYVAAAKAGMPSGGDAEIAGNLYLSRSIDCCIGKGETCYRGIMAWLLKAGLVSMRWFMKETSPNGEVSLDLLFGKGEVVWPPDRPFKDDSVLPQIAAGYIVHMWLEDTGVGGWNGHWVVSNGDGTICGVNNGPIQKPDEVVAKDYTTHGRLRSQFEGYGGYLVEEKVGERGFLKTPTPKIPLQWGKASLVKFDPETIP